MSKEAQRFYLDRGTDGIGCIDCQLRATCGGVRRIAPIWNCGDMCCGNPETCSLVCEFSEQFPLDLLEIGGFGFDEVTEPFVVPDEPPGDYVPALQHPYLTNDIQDYPWVAIPLREIFKPVRGVLTPAYCCGTELRARFGVAPTTRILALGIAKDPFIERYWLDSEYGAFADALRALGIDLVVTQNYSMFLNEPRTQHMHNRKRIIISAAELSQVSIPAAMVLQAVCEDDWRYWCTFLEAHSEISVVALEFQTGWGNRSRGREVIKMLAKIQDSLGRDLHLVAIGGCHLAREIGEHFRKSTIVDSTPFMKAAHYQIGYFFEERVRWRRGGQIPSSVRLRRNVFLREAQIRKLRTWKPSISIPPQVDSQLGLEFSTL